MDRTPGARNAGDDGSSLASPDGAGEDMRQRGLAHQISWHDSLVSQLLGDRLIPRNLSQSAVAVLVVAGVSDLKDVVPRPHRDEQRERRCHPGCIGVGFGALLNRFVAPLRAFFQRLDEVDPFFVEPIVTTSALGDVPRRHFESHPARLLALQTSAHAIGDHHERSDALLLERDLFEWDTRLSNRDALAEGADHEVILILGANLSAMSYAISVQLVVARLATDSIERRNLLRLNHGASHAAWRCCECFSADPIPSTTRPPVCKLSSNKLQNFQLPAWGFSTRTGRAKLVPFDPAHSSTRREVRSRTSLQPVFAGDRQVHCESSRQS